MGLKRKIFNPIGALALHRLNGSSATPGGDQSCLCLVFYVRDNTPAAKGNLPLLCGKAAFLFAAVTWHRCHLLGLHGSWQGLPDASPTSPELPLR